MSFINVKDINYYYQDGDTKRFILKDVSCEFEKGKFYTILGESGSGKTTFLSLISALDEPKAGEVFYQDENIKKIGFEEFRRNKVRNYISRIQFSTIYDSTRKYFSSNEYN